MGERNIYFQYGDCLYNEEIRVPLIIKGGAIPKGKIIDCPIQLIDIMPSLLDILRIKRKDINIEGSSLLPLILNKKKNNCNFAFSEAGVTKIINGSVVDAQQKCIIAKEWKLIYEESKYGISYGLYNLKNDPNETNNLMDSEKKQFEFLKAKLEEWMNRPKPNISPLSKPLDEENERKLKSLGYLQ